MIYKVLCSLQDLKILKNIPFYKMLMLILIVICEVGVQSARVLILEINYGIYDQAEDSTCKKMYMQLNSKPYGPRKK